MYPNQIQVSETYIEQVGSWLINWVQKEDSYTLSQFIKEKGISYQFLKMMTYQSLELANTYDIVKSTLHTKWLKLAMEKDELPPHRAKVLMRYLRLYDSHGMDIELETRKAVAQVEMREQINYSVENYAGAPLEATYKLDYEKQANPAGSDKEAQ